MWDVERCEASAELPVTINVFQMTENLRTFIALKVLKRTEVPNVWGNFALYADRSVNF